MTTTREFPMNIFDAKSHEDPTLLPMARQEDPVFDIQKHGNTRVLSFGKLGTLHYCLGEGLARMVAREALLAVNERGLLEHIVPTDQVIQAGTAFFMTPARHLVQIR